MQFFLHLRGDIAYNECPDDDHEGHWTEHPKKGCLTCVFFSKYNYVYTHPCTVITGMLCFSKYAYIQSDMADFD